MRLELSDDQDTEGTPLRPKDLVLIFPEGMEEGFKLEVQGQPGDFHVIVTETDWQARLNACGGRFSSRKVP